MLENEKISVNMYILHVEPGKIMIYLYKNTMGELYDKKETIE